MEVNGQAVICLAGLGLGSAWCCPGHGTLGGGVKQKDLPAVRAVSFTKCTAKYPGKLVYCARRHPRAARNDISALPVTDCPRYCAFILALTTPSTLLVAKQTPLELLLLLILRHVNTICISKAFSCHKPYFGSLVLTVTKTCLSLLKNTNPDLGFWCFLSVFVQKLPQSLVQENRAYSYWYSRDIQVYLCSF